MANVPNLTGCDVVFLNDGHLVIAYGQADVAPRPDGTVLVSIPVAFYDEEWQWLYGGSVHLGAEPQDVVVAEAKHWLKNIGAT